MANIYVTVYFALFFHALFTLFWTKRTWNIVNPGTKFLPSPPPPPPPHHCPLFLRLRWKCLEQTYLANSLVSCMLFSNVHSQNYPWTKARENSRKRCEFVFSIRTPLRSALPPSHPPSPPPRTLCLNASLTRYKPLSRGDRIINKTANETLNSALFSSRDVSPSSLMKWVTGREIGKGKARKKEERKKKENREQLEDTCTIWCDLRLFLLLCRHVN